ncbi:rhodanese-like domain-containing protein [Halomicrobium salinisoli]|uniref:rhodanese-like domain-containing protein n=1 Tax=Halomicrobium salinisoli TaxID=2878391 RepID=UPI001CF0AAE7|nr:rhodanese-like domain-containing protein [Halomicrobium salinisoli]
MDGEIGTEELRERLDDEETRVVDIRPPRAYRRGHVPGSENVPLGQLVQDVERFDGDEDVVTLCPHGKSSVKAARLIAAYEGFEGDVVSYEPGLSEWDGPIEEGSAEAEADSAAEEGPESPF